MNSYLLFYLYPFVHINIKDKILFYNTLNGKHLIEEKYIIRKLINNLLNHPNKTLVLNQELINDPEISEFAEKIKSLNMGDFIETQYSKKQAIQLMYDLKVQKGIEFLKDKEDRVIGEEILNYLSDVTVYLNNTCSLNCKSCSYDYKQTIACKKSEPNKELDVKIIEQQLKLYNQIPIDTLHITGGNVFQYSVFQNLQNYIIQNNFTTILYINGVNFIKSWKLIKYKNAHNITYNILVNNYSDLYIKELATVLTDNFNNYIITFLIESEKQYNEMEKIVDKFNFPEIEVKAIYNGNNLDFFKENVFIDEETIFDEKQNLQDIVRKQGVNANFFGKLVIDSDGEVYSNILGKSLGNISNQSIQGLIEQELKNNQFWRLLRTDVLFCSSCCYNHLCPEISNYEFILHKYNLCHIKNN